MEDLNILDIAPEIQEEVLFSTKGPQLIRLCGANSTFRSLCASSVFWHRKFAEDNLPLLDEGEDAHSWLEIYSQSYYANNQAEEDLANLRPGLFLEVPLLEVKNINDILLPSVEQIEVQAYWNLAKASGDIQAREEELRELEENVLADYQSYSRPFEEIPADLSEEILRLEELRDIYANSEEVSLRILIDDQKDIFYQLHSEPINFPEESINREFPISRDDLYLLLFKLYYEGYFEGGN